MKNRFVKITLTLCMLLVMAVPTQVFAAEKCNTNTVNSFKNNYSNIYSQFTNGSMAKIKESCTKVKGADYQQVLELFKNCNLNGSEQKKPAVPNKENNTKPEVKVPVTPTEPSAPVNPTTPVEKETPKTEVPSDTAIGSYEQQVVNLVNKERAAVGLPALKVNTKLSGVAELKAEDLRDKNYFAHNSPTYGSPFDMMKQYGVKYTTAGENIAKGQRTPESVMNGWMNSQGHKDNILNASFTEIGVGYVTDSNGTTYWVQMFIRP